MTYWLGKGLVNDRASDRLIDGGRRTFMQSCLGVASFVGLSGCSVLTRDGPSAGSIETGAAQVVKGQSDDKPVFDYVMLDINESIVSLFGTPPKTSLYQTFGQDKGPAPEIHVGVGDVLQVSVFESQAGGLFIPNDAGARAGNFVTMPPVTIDRKGSITVPYAGDLPAVGKTIPELQKSIEKALVNRAVEPQAVVSIVSRSSTQASVVGAVNTPSKIEVGPAGERVLDMIAKANGITHPGYETYITVQRGEREATVYFDTILANPRENIFIKPGDIVYVYQETHSFLAFGAVRAPGKFDFGAPEVTLAEAVAKASGLDDGRADPREIFLYRTAPRKLVEKANVPLDKFPAEVTEIPVVFHANFRDSASYFAALKFKIEDKDVVYVSNADSYELYKFLTLINNTSGTVANLPSNIATARNAAKSLGQ